MKRVDKILTHLRADGKRRLSSIAKEEGIAVSTVFEHVKHLQEVIITRHVPLLRYAALGYPFRNIAYWQPANKDAVDTIGGLAPVNTLLKGTGDVYMIESLFSTMQAQELFLERLQEQGELLHASNIIETIAQESWVPER